MPAWPPASRLGIRRWLFGAVFAASVLVEVIGAVTSPSARHVESNVTPKGVDWAHDRLWDWRDPQLVRLLRNGPVWPGFRNAPERGRSRGSRGAGRPPGGRAPPGGSLDPRQGSA